MSGNATKYVWLLPIRYRLRYISAYRCIFVFRSHLDGLLIHTPNGYNKSKSFLIRLDLINRRKKLPH